jgi:hypothetical protein
MQGLGLQNAVRSHQQGVAWRQDQDQRAKEQKRQQVLEEADKAFAGVIDSSRARWAMDGAHGVHKPSDMTMFRAAEVRGLALAKAGDWENYLRNEATVQNQRIRARSTALQQYEQDGDIDRLVRSVYPTVFDGAEIVGTEMLAGGPEDAPKGAPSGPTKLRVRIRGADGKETTNLVNPADVVARVKTSLVDPAVFAQKEIEANLARTKMLLDTEGKIAVERVKGEEGRKTDGVKAKTDAERDKAKNAFALELAGVNNKAAGERARTSANATLGAATIRSGGGTGSGSRADRLQSTKVDSNGYIVGVFANGTSRRLNGTDGKPIRSGEWAKRVDQMVRVLQKDTLASMDKSPAELRKQAEVMVAGEDGASPGSAEPGAKDYSNLWK